jgi:hypothetical protein
MIKITNDIFRSKKAKTAVSLILLCVVALFFIFMIIKGVFGEGGAIRYVDDDNPNASEATCLLITNPCESIQNAIDVANNGDIIQVFAGTYDEEQITISKSLVITGTIDNPPTINGDNAELVDAGLVRITATGNVTFSNFILNSTGAQTIDSKTYRYGIYASSDTSRINYTISNVKIYGNNTTDDEEDIGLYSNGKEDLVFTNSMITQTGTNPILLENHTGSSEISNNVLDVGVYGDDAISYIAFGVDITTLQNISNNTIDAGTGGPPFTYDQRASAISFHSASGVSTGKFTSIQITNNSIINVQSYRKGISFWNSAAGDGTLGEISSPYIYGNNITGNADANESIGVQFTGLVTNANISNNYFRILSTGFNGSIGTSGNHYATGSLINFNSFISNNRSLSWNGTTTLNAEKNWWGNNDGPLWNGQVNGNVDYSPFCSDASCTQTTTGTSPAVNVGADVSTNSQFTKTATASDSGSGIASYLWTRESGTGTITFGSPAAVSTTITADTSDTYTIRLTVTDNAGNFAYDEFVLTWTPSNTAPEVRNITITPSPANTTDTLNCSAIYYDAEGGKGNVSIYWYNGSVEFSKEIITNVNNGMMLSFPLPKKIYQNPTNETGCSGNFDPTGPCSNATDSDWDTYATGDGNGGFIYENFTIPSLVTSANLTVKLSSYPSSQKGDINITIYNNLSSNFEQLKYYYEIPLTNETLEIPKTSLNNAVNNTLQLRTFIEYNPNPIPRIGRYYEGAIEWLIATPQVKGETWNCTINATDNSSLAGAPNSTTKTIINSPPTTPQAGGVENNSRTTSNLVTIKAENSTDADGDAINYTFWNWSGSVPLLLQNLTSTSYNWTTVDGYSYCWYANASDNAGGVSEGTPEICFIENAKPVVTNISISPSVAYSGSALNCSANFSDVQGYAWSGDPDVEYDKLNVTFSWYNGSELYSRITINNISQNGTSTASFSLSAGIASKGEVWNCSVNATDSYEEGAPNSTTITISNTPPTVNNIIISPTPAYARDTLSCSAIYNDSDNDKGNVSITWYLNSAFYSATTILNVSNGDAVSKTRPYIPEERQHHGQIWNCTINATDSGGVAGLPNSTAITLSNTAPQIYNISINPATAYKNSTLNCSAFFEDADDFDKGNVSIYWYNGSTIYSNVTISDIFEEGLVSFNLTSGMQAKGETWNCTVNATDNSSLAGAPNSTTITITNTVSEIFNREILPTTVYKASNLTYNFTIGDIDTGDVDCIVMPYKNDVAQPSLQKLFVNQANNSQILGNLTNTSYSKGETWLFQIVCNDSSNLNSSLANTSSKIIQNSAPVLLTSPIATPDTIYKTTIGINCTDGIYSDADNDALTRNYLWYSNNISTSVNTQNMSNSSSYFVKGNQLTCYFYVNDGTANSDILSSSNLTILNTPPSIPTLYFNDTNTSNNLPTFNWSNPDDADSDVISYSYEVYNNTTFNDTYLVQRNFTGQNYTLTNALPEGRYYWRVLVNDTEPSNSSWSSNNTILIDTTKPSINYTLLSPAELKFGQNLSITAKVVDNPSGIVVVQAKIIGRENSTELELSSLGIYNAMFENISRYITQDGIYSIEVNATDYANNSISQTKIFNVSSISSVVNSYLNTTLNLTRSSLSSIAADNVNTSIENLNVSSNLTTSISITQSSSAANSSFVGIPELGKYIEIFAPELEGKINSAIIKIYYSDSEVSAKGIDESTLRLWYYNSTDATWAKYDSPDGGVDTTNNYVWANTTHFSLWGLFGSSPFVAPPTTTGGGGGGGGGGGCFTTWNCTEWSDCINGNQTRTCTKIKPPCNADKKPEESQACTIQNITQTPTPAANITINATNLTTQITPPAPQGFNLGRITGAAIRTARNILGEDIYQVGRSGYYAIKNNKRIVFAIIIIAVILLFIVSMLSSPKGYYDRAIRLHRKAEIYYNNGNFAKANALFNEAQTYREKGEEAEL